MNRLIATLWLGSTIACARDPHSAPTEQPPAPSSTARTSLAEAALDPRRPLPLLAAMANHQRESMREHLAAVRKIVAALSRDDYASAESAAELLGSSSQMNQMCNHLGAAAPEFTTQALAFHQTADRIADAARASDQKRVLGELSATLETCVACHAGWRQEIVDEPTWRELVSAQKP
jgi:cytochrome c556